ncbi:RodZ domain-containing protein [Marinobacter pelagius]|uniref:Cytoskeleton protein RodZ n=1 Tax=Marinobacter pelagius TaxID=379482 RepID=A0A1I4VZ58_9GAMM|nr:RodZ domain-containing protein [Marinobacter pelagius]SFN06266.1 cytoskeleton protein RodZ [Marinobacter pelagius]
MTSDENPQSVVSDPVGVQLKRAREKLGLGVEDIARAQHLRPAIIQAIENSEHTRVDSELFLKGYVRTYASQVGLDPDSIITDLDRELEPLRIEREQQQEANPLVDIERRRRQKRRMAKILVWILAVALAGYLGYRFVLQDDSAPVTEEAPEQTSGVQSEGDQTGGDSPSGSEAPVTEDAVEPEPVEEELSAPETESVSGDTVAEAPPEPMAEEITVEEPAQEPAVEQPVPVVEEPEPLVENPEEPVVVADTASLEMTFTADCWVQVSDADGNRLVASLQRQGDRINVSGDAPLRVVIGAVDAVGSVRFQGETVDLGDFRVANNRTEFTLSL